MEGARLNQLAAEAKWMRPSLNQMVKQMLVQTE